MAPDENLASRSQSFMTNWNNLFVQKERCEGTCTSGPCWTTGAVFFPR